MKTGWFPRRRAAATAFCLLAAAGGVGAQACDPRAPQLQFARDNLQRAASEADVPTAHDYADRARREFDHLAALAGRCGCPAAQAKFAQAAALIRPVQDAETRREVRELLARVRPLFEAGQLELRECAGR